MPIMSLMIEKALTKSDQEYCSSDVTLTSVACTCVTHVCGSKMVGSRIARGGVSPTSCKMGYSCLAAWDYSGWEFASVHTRPPPQESVFVLKD